MSTLREVTREARARQRRPRVILIILGVVVLTALIAARPVMRLWGAMQSERHLAVARAALERQDFMAALEAVQQAARATPQDREMLRTGVQVLAGLEAAPDEMLATLGQLEAVGGMTPEMYLLRARAQLQRGDLLAAEQALNMLPEAERQSWEAVELEASLLLRQGRAVEAGERLQTSTDSTEGTAFRRAVLELAVRPGAGSFPARQVIWQTARADGMDKLLALTLLSQDATLSAGEAEELLRLTDQIAAPGLRQAVLAQVFRLMPERKEALIQTESSRAAGQPVEQQVSFLLFLAKQQAPQAMLDYLAADGRTLAAQSPADYVNLKLEALAKLKDWEAVRQAMKTDVAQHLGSLPLHLWEACTTAALEPGSPAVLEHLQRAYQATGQGRDRAGATRVADTALNLRQTAFAATCYEEIAAQPMLPADKALLLERACHALAESRDTPALRRMARALADQTPGHLHHAYRADYLDILCGEPLEVIVQRLNAAQNDAAASDPAFQARQRLLWAMIFNRREQKDMLPRELQGLEKAAEWTPGERAVIAGLLAKSGEPARAWQLVEKLPESLLLNEEAELAKAAR